MSGVSKGTGNENRARDMLLARGYVLERAYKQVFWIGPGIPRSRHVDLFGAFDFIGYPGEHMHSPRSVINVQVTTHHGQNLRERRQKIETFVQKLDPSFADDIDLELWSFGYLKTFGHHLRIQRFDVKLVEWSTLGHYKYDGRLLEQSSSPTDFDFWPPHVRDRLKEICKTRAERAATKALEIAA